MTHPTYKRPSHKPQTFPTRAHELKSIIYYLASNPDALLPTEIITSTDPDTILDFSITSRNAHEEFAHLVEVTDNLYAVTLFGHGNKIPFIRLEKLFEEMKVVVQSFDLHDREDGQALQGAISRLTRGEGGEGGESVAGEEGERFLKVLIKGNVLGNADEIIAMALDGRLVKILREEGIDAQAGDPYVLREIIDFW
jgi:hypothetical protein